MRYKKFITKGVIEPLSRVPFHSKAPIKRISMLNQKNIPEANIHIAIHFIDTATKMSRYSKLHCHNVDEINMILSNEKLIYEIQFEDEIYKVKSPATIFIPKGTKHRADVISGKGMFVCMIMAKKYKTW